MGHIHIPNSSAIHPTFSDTRKRGTSARAHVARTDVPYPLPEQYAAMLDDYNVFFLHVLAQLSPI